MMLGIRIRMVLIGFFLGAGMATLISLISYHKIQQAHAEQLLATDMNRTIIALRAILRMQDAYANNPGDVDNFLEKQLEVAIRQWERQKNNPYVYPSYREDMESIIDQHRNLTQ
jgi:hypothetical protein